MEDGRPVNIFGLIRHAPTVWNRKKRIQGRDDSPLTSEGERQAIEWGRRLTAFQWDHMITSSSGRALKTAELINISLKIPVVEDPKLQEQDWGEWTGKTLKQVKMEAPELFNEQVAMGWEFCPPGGEDLNSVWNRSQQALHEAAVKWPDTKILLVVHEGVIKSLLNRLSGRQFLPTEPTLLLKNHMHLLVDDRKGLKIKKINALSLDV